MKLVSALILWFWAGLVALADPAVSASLSESSTDVDHPVQLNIKIENARVTRPPNVTAEGLAIDFAGTSSQTQILNLQASSITTFTYIVTPTRAGTFQIPPIEVVAGGKVYKTASLTLQVVQENGNNADGSANQGKPFFGELIVPKESAYVGEEIPIELRFYFSQGIEYQPYPQGQYPQFDGEGFVTKKYPEPTEKRLTVNGRTYNVVVYRTGLCGVKPGKLDLNSATQTFLIAAPFGSRSVPGLIDPAQPFQQQVAEMKTNGASLQIKPIPTDGRPASFSGAVGDFTLASSANPLKANTGDPITLNVEISGLGNFDRMEQPVLTSTDGWRVYQPSEQIKALDDIGLSGIKRYSYTLIAAQPLNRLPDIEFSYFNPVTEKFVTLKSIPASIDIEGAKLPDIVAKPGAPGASPVQKTRPQTAPDVLDIREQAPVPASFVPLIRQRNFWIAQAIPAVALLLLGSLAGIKRAVIADRPQRMANRERRLLLRKIDDSESRPEVLQAAVRFLELSLVRRTAANMRLPRSLEESVRNVSLPDELRNDVRDLIAERESTIYGHVGSESLSEAERSKIKTILSRWQRVSKSVLGAVCIVGSLTFGGLHALAVSEWNIANSTYRDGKYEEAKVDYLRIAHSGQYSADLFYNLGNAWFKLGDQGRAILNYERALLLDPGFEEAKSNLRSILKLVGNENQSTFRDLVGSYADDFAIIASVAFWAFAFALVACFWKPAGLAAFGRAVCVITALIFLVSGSALLWIGEGTKNRDRATVVDSSAELKYGPAMSGRSVETLGIGDHVQVISERGDWTFCRASSGSLGWIISQKIERIIP